MKLYWLVVGLIIGTLAMSVASAQSPDDNVLAWDVVPGATTIHIERQDAAVCNTGSTAPWAEIATIPAGTGTYTDPAVANPFGVCYRAAASNANGKSGYSNEAGKVPGVPIMLRVL